MDASCERYDDVVRLIQKEGVIAVVLPGSGAYGQQGIAHIDPAGLTIPTALMMNATAVGAIRDQFVAGNTVRGSLQAVQYLASHVSNVSMQPGETRRFYVSMVPSIGASINFDSVDVLPTIAGVNTNGLFTGGECAGVTFVYDRALRSIVVKVPASMAFTRICRVGYLVSVSQKYEVQSGIGIYVGLPAVLNDQAWTQPGTPVVIDVLANDLGADTVKVASRIDLNIATDAIDQNILTNQGSWGVENGKVKFTPAEGFLGLASANYRVAGAKGNFTDVATIRVKVTATPPAYAESATKTAREFFLPERGIYFLTANAAEASVVASGAAGPWVETGFSFPVGGPQPICRFYGNAKTNPATNAPFGPQSHFYTIDQGECESLKAAFNAGAKSWNFESLDFNAIALPATKVCPTETFPVYRAYNNGFPSKDSNHRYSVLIDEMRQLVQTGWSYEGPVFCVPFAS